MIARICSRLLTLYAGNAVAIFCCVIQHQPHRDKRHKILLIYILIFRQSYTEPVGIHSYSS
jgi:hypothetical protein